MDVSNHLAGGMDLDRVLRADVAVHLPATDNDGLVLGQFANEDIAENGAEDVYGSFNILMRRKPKENNFKAILDSIRDLMNEYCIVPKWLENIFLGYGDPSAAQWTNMPDLLETVDFKDTFLDDDHLIESFSEYEVGVVYICFKFFTNAFILEWM